MGGAGSGVSAAGHAVDAHVHLWDTGRFALAWFRPELGLPVVARIDDLAENARGGVTPVGPIRGAIAVQAADTAEEVRWLTALRHPLLAGVVLQYDPVLAPGSRPPAANGAGTVRGVRVAVPGRRADLSDVAGLDALCDGTAASGEVVEFLVRPEQLPAVAGLAARHPTATFVVCHLGLGASDPDESWTRAVSEAAARPNVAAKVSGVVTASAASADDADPAGDSGRRLRRVLQVAVDAFGAHRLLFGSDWPMSARVAPYDQIVARTAAALPPLGAAGDAAFWGGTARELYRL